MEIKIPFPEFNREDATEIYLKHGGVLKIEEGQLIYPDRKRIEAQLNFCTKKLDYLDPSIKSIEKKHSDLGFNVPNFFKVVSDPLYWKHFYKKMTDEEYKNSSIIVEPPINRINDEKYKKIVKQFLENDNYRKNMYEAKTSIINENTLSESIEKNVNESRKLLSTQLVRLKKEREVFAEKKKALEVFLDWVV